VDKTHPHWWANKYYGGIVPSSNIDKGILSIYILNIVNVPKYQGVFQGAGLLHAYLEGQNIELMANSDNVLRGGLTPKHIDIEELLQHIQFEPTYPSILKGDFTSSNDSDLTLDFSNLLASSIEAEPAKQSHVQVLQRKLRQRLTEQFGICAQNRPNTSSQLLKTGSKILSKFGMTL
jgi:mannose-6-phosphate isomerase class I